MIYPYTWNHLVLFAKLCAKIEKTDSTMTSSWVNIVQDHHSTTFPFTLWPLSYRTSDISTSPSMCSPSQVKFPGPICEVTVKIYVCNEVVIVCVQNGRPSGDQSSSCEFPYDSRLKNENHAENHCDDTSAALLPCNVSRLYTDVKKTILPRVNKTVKDSSNTKEKIKCVICIGHKLSASIASCLAVDIGKVYERQRDFLGRSKKEVSVDFIGFSTPPVASSGYWAPTGKYVDNYISVDGPGKKTTRNGTLIPNPSTLRVPIPTLTPSRNNRSKSLLNIMSRGGSEKKDNDLTEVGDFVSAINKQIQIEYSNR